VERAVIGRVVLDVLVCSALTAGIVAFCVLGRLALWGRDVRR
jgi:hypothetical protein